MTFNQAVSLIERGVSSEQPQCWADLGCGEGMFSKALSMVLPTDSMIYAIDKHKQSRIRSENEMVGIEFHQADFTKEIRNLPKLDGILMANALHFIRQKTKLIRQLEGLFASHPKFIIVEYERSLPNPWVPFPLKYEALVKLFNELGRYDIQKLAEVNSSYGAQKIYAALVSKLDG